MTRRALLAIAVPAALVPAALFALLAPPRIPPPTGAPGGGLLAHPSPAYARLLAGHVREGTIDGVRVGVVDYAALSRDPDYPLALAELAEAQPETMSRDERMAYWMNAYNLLAIRLVVDEYPIGSILEVGTEPGDVWGMKAGTAGGRAVSLGEIEDTLRRDFRDPRVHFALVAAAVSCPDLRSYDPNELDAQLEEAARDFLANERRGARVARDGVEVSRLLHASQAEFEARGGVVAFLRSHAPPSVAERLEGARVHDLGKLPYDWSLNDLARTSVAQRPTRE